MAPKPLTGGYLDIPETSLCERSRLSREPGAVQVLQTFQTDVIARVKVGVGRPVDAANLATYVLTPFDRGQAGAVDAACTEAANRVLKLLDTRTGLPKNAWRGNDRRAPSDAAHDARASADGTGP